MTTATALKTAETHHPRKRSDARAEFLWGLFVTAMEGGIGYWSVTTEYRQYTKESLAANRAARKADLSVSRYDGLVDDYHGFEAHVADCEDWADARDRLIDTHRDLVSLDQSIVAYLRKRGLLHRVTIETIARGVSLISKGGTTVKAVKQAFVLNPHSTRLIREASRENDAAGPDADDADSILQAGVFGAVVYG